MEEVGLEGELARSHMRVPWPSWDHWNSVRSSLFSSSPQSVAAALDRIRGWRSRGRLPVAIEVTAAIIEVQQKDPFFSKAEVGGHSEEMLSMLYSMAIMRLVNGFVEKVHGFDNHAQKHALRKDKQSVSELADALGVPRILVDIRHETSHSDLPSLSLLRLAITKALKWLKSNYWNPQQRAIPDVRKEVKFKLRQLVLHMNNKESSKSSSRKGRRIKQSGLFPVCGRLSSQITGKLLTSKYDGTQKHVSRILKAIAHLYSESPEEVISPLLDFYMSQSPSLSCNIGGQGIDSFDTRNPETHGSSANDLRSVIIKLSRKRPGLLLALLKEVLDRIEVRDMQSSQGELCTKSLDKSDIQQLEHLSSLVPWLLVGLKELKDAGQVEIIDDAQLPFSGINIIPKVSLTNLLRRCLLLSASGNKHLSDSVRALLEMTSNKLVSEKLRRLPIFSLSDKHSASNFCNRDQEYDSLAEEQAIKKAKLEFDALRSRLKGNRSKNITIQNGNKKVQRMWTLARTWNPCPIGMLPCSFSSAAYLPVLDKSSNSCDNKELEDDNGKSGSSLSRKREGNQQLSLPENSSAQKRQKEMSQDIAVDVNDSFVRSPLKGILLIDGAWREVGEEELQVIESDIRIIVK